MKTHGTEMPVDTPTTKVVGFLLPATTKWLAITFLLGRSARCGYAITRRRAERIAPYAVCLLPTYSVELQMFRAPTKSLCARNPHLQVYALSSAWWIFPQTGHLWLV